MNRSHSLVGLVSLFLVALVPVAACADATRIAPDDLAAHLEGDAPPLLLDVRTPEEFAKGHVPGALLIPIQELEERLPQIAAYRERGVVTYCESGRRAQKAIELLEAAGFRNLALLDGSMRRWREEKRAVEAPK